MDFCQGGRKNRARTVLRLSLATAAVDVLLLSQRMDKVRLLSKQLPTPPWQMRQASLYNQSLDRWIKLGSIP